jgi:hypothetical protein
MQPKINFKMLVVNKFLVVTNESYSLLLISFFYEEFFERFHIRIFRPNFKLSKPTSSIKQRMKKKSKKNGLNVLFFCRRTKYPLLSINWFIKIIYIKKHVFFVPIISFCILMSLLQLHTTSIILVLVIMRMDDAHSLILIVYDSSWVSY